MLKNPPASAGDIRDMGSVSGLGRSPGVGNGNLLQYSYLENSLVGYSPWGRKESDMTEHTFFHIHEAPLSILESCII